MSEATMNRRVRSALRGLDPVRVENPAGPGTPDWNYTGGWIECKWLRAWPVDHEAVVQLKHFTVQQRAWLRRRCRAGGRAWVLLKVADDWMLIWGATAAEHLGRLSRGQTMALADRVWHKGLNEGELRECLTSQAARATASS